MGEIQLTSPRRLSASSMPLMVTGDFGDVQSFGEEADAAVDLAQPLLAVEVVAVFRTVSVLGGPGDDLDDLGPLHVEQVHQFLAQAAPALRREVVARAGRQRRQARRLFVIGVGRCGVLAHEGLVHGMRGPVGRRVVRWWAGASEVMVKGRGAWGGIVAAPPPLPATVRCRLDGAFSRPHDGQESASAPSTKGRTRPCPPPPPCTA